MSGKFRPSYIQTRAGDLFKKDIRVNGSQVRLHIFDTAGQESLKTVIKSLYRNAQGILLVFDFSRRVTLKHIDDWISLIKSNCDVMPEIVLAGNKTDLHESKKEVTETQGEEVARLHDIKFLKASAKKNLNIEEAFHTLSKQILDVKMSNEQQALQNGTVKIYKEHQQKTSKCCFG